MTVRRRRTLSELTDGYGVLTVGTFSKVIATGLRVGWVQARPDWIRAMVPARFDMGNSPLLHQMLHEFMVRGSFHEHVDEMRKLYALKAQTLAGALEPYGEPYFDVIEPAGGFFLWLKLRSGLTGDAVRDFAAEDGLSFASGNRFYPSGDPGEDGESVRLAYSWRAGGDAGRRGGASGSGVSSGGERSLRRDSVLRLLLARRLCVPPHDDRDECDFRASSNDRGLGPVSSTGRRDDSGLFGSSLRLPRLAPGGSRGLPGRRR